MANASGFFSENKTIGIDQHNLKMYNQSFNK